MTEPKTEKARFCAGAESCSKSERSLVGRRWRPAGRRFRFLLVAIELAHDISANRPRRDLRGLRLLAFAIRLFVGRTDEAALDEYVRAFLDAVENVLGYPAASSSKMIPFIPRSTIERSAVSVNYCILPSGILL